ncbi:YbaB/EbfC family nucleoid-associated protein [Natronoglycomyces albus]|uniref:YbaB/EbfC family nucleoid-associated protein n=1 Tax=Natronoglycomyces albus TaxID=2811108 RepID=A0A895XFD4_9ACTN|nr:YbaB/EbfC family nucleoid-associated protein [Natronoglycomyces albus]QSB04034.1 YbaB/EbfC family nucleoid-associated protein [Natronoglycomyces albus]
MDEQDFQAKADRLKRMVEEAELEVTSENKEVSVLMGPAGSIKELELSHRALRLSGSELGTMIVETLARGRQEIDADLNAKISATLGETFGGTGEQDFFSGGLPDLKDVIGEDENTEEEKK